MKKLPLLLIILLGVLLSACGGGGGGTASSVGGSAVVGDAGDTMGSAVVQERVDLSWSAPTTRTDGSYLSPSELEGYRIYYGTSPDNLEMHLDTDETSASFTDLTQGVYYFAVTAYDAEGLESGLSQVVSKEIS